VAGLRSARIAGIPDPQIVELIGLAGFDAAFNPLSRRTAVANSQELIAASINRIVYPGSEGAFSK